VTLAAGLALALGSAVALNWGWVEQHGAAAALPPLTLRRPVASLALLFRNLRWLVGFVTGLGGWALYVVALAFAPLSLVQATAAGGIGIIALFSHRRGAALRRGEVRAVAVATAGLVLLAVSLAGGTPHSAQPSAGALAAWLGVSGAAAALFAGARAAAALGLASGVLYAAGDVATKAMFGGGAWIVLVAVVLAAHGLAFATLQLGFQRGGALATAGVSTLLTNALPIVAGLLVFGEHLPGGGYAVARVAAFGAVVAGAALLARGS
jgi:hypothetical protein